jgi:dihydrolipoamide dehydrogenase
MTVPRALLSLSSSFDHRIIDGWGCRHLRGADQVGAGDARAVVLGGRALTDSDVDVAIVGGGPGGYTAALRCAAHGLSTVLVDAEQLGGTCRNVGCIPSKAVIHVGDRYSELGSAGGLETLGISTTRSLDLEQTMRWKDAVVDHLRAGVESLLERAGVQTIHG